MILQGMKYIESVSCIRFFPASNTTVGYVKFVAESTGCTSNVGYLGKMQKINLQLYDVGKGCFQRGKIWHEILHTLGFYHQHSATDRDDYILVVQENIADGSERFFNKFESTVITDFDVGYDYESIMHYGPKAFSKNGENTIIPLMGDAIEIGQRRKLSEKDILKLNLMHECNVEEKF